MTLARLKAMRQYKFDTVALLLTTAQIFVCFYLAVWYAQKDPYISIVCAIFIIMSVTGLALHQFFCGGIRFKNRITQQETTNILLFSIIGFTAVMGLQTFVVRAISAIALITTFEAWMFYGSGAIAEENFFRYYAQTLATKSLPKTYAIVSEIIAITGISFLFTTYHFLVYRTDISALWAVFLSSLVLGTVYELSKRVSVSQLTHVITNISALIPK